MNDYQYSRGEYHPADPTRNASLNCYTRRPDSTSSPSRLSIVANVDDMSDPAAPRPPSPDTPALTSPGRALPSDGKGENQNDSPDEVKAEEVELARYEDQEDGDDNGDYDDDASEGRDNPFSPSSNLDQRAGSSQTSSASSALSDPSEKDTVDGSAVECLPLSDKEEVKPSNSPCSSPVSPISPNSSDEDRTDRPVSPVSPIAEDEQVSIPNVSTPQDSQALLRSERRHSHRKLKRRLSTVVAKCVGAFDAQDLRQSVDAAAGRLTADQMLKALKEHLPKTADLERKNLRLKSSHNNLRKQNIALAGGLDVMEELEHMQKKLTWTEGELDYINEQLTLTKKALRSKDEECTELIDESRYYRSEYDITDRELKALKTQAEREKIQKEAFLEDLEATEGEELQTRQAELVAGFINTRADLKDLRKQAKFAEIARANLTQELIEVKAGIADAKEADAARAENEKALLTQLEEVKRQAADAEDRERAALEQNKALEAISKDTIANMNTVEIHVRKMELDLAESKQELAESKEREANAREQYEMLQMILASALRKIDKKR